MGTFLDAARFVFFTTIIGKADSFRMSGECHDVDAVLDVGAKLRWLTTRERFGFRLIAAKADPPIFFGRGSRYPQRVGWPAPKLWWARKRMCGATRHPSPPPLFSLRDNNFSTLSTIPIISLLLGHHWMVSFPTRSCHRSVKYGDTVPMY